MTDATASLEGKLLGGPSIGAARSAPAAEELRGLVRYAWLPIAGFVAAVCIFYWRASPEILEHKQLASALNFVFVMGSAFFVATLAARSHVAQPSLSILFLGVGALTLGYAGLLASASLLWLDASSIAVVYRVTALLAALCHLVGAIAELLAPHKRLNSRYVWLAAAYCGLTALVALLVIAIRMGWMPVFFIPGKGPTFICQIVTSLGAVFFVLAGFILSQEAGENVRFRRWYACGLFLFAISLVAGSLQYNYGDVMSWTNRFAKSLGGVYLVIATVVYFRQCGTWMLPLELALRQTEEQLRAANGRLALALRAGRAGFFDWDLKSGSVFRSPELAALLQCSERCRRSPDGRWCDCVAPEDLELADAILRRCMEERREEVDFELRVISPAGGSCKLACQGRIRYDADGTPARMIGIAIDVTDRRRAEEEVINLNHDLERRVLQRTEALERANAELESFAYSVSHDLRTPLRGVDGFSRILLETYKDRLDPEGQRYLSLVRNSTVRMARLIDDLLSFASLSRCALKPEPVDMEALAREIFEELRAREPGRDIRLEASGLPVAACDRALMRKVLENLLSNAIRFTASRAVAEIRIEGKSDVGECVYTIKDNGVGFDMKYIHKLFGVFQRLHSGDEFEGTGIGLAIVKRSVELHGGRVWAESEMDKGAAIHFALPLIAAPGSAGDAR